MEEVAGAMSSGTAPGAPRAASAVGVPSRTGPLSQSAEVGFCHARVRTWETHSWVTMALGVPFGRLQGVLRENPQCGPAWGRWGARGGKGGLLKKLTTKWPRRRQPRSCPDAPRTESGVSRRCAPRAPWRLAERGTCPRAHRGVAGTAGRHPAVKGGRSDTRPNAPATPWGPCAD